MRRRARRRLCLRRATYSKQIWIQDDSRHGCANLTANLLRRNMDLRCTCTGAAWSVSHCP